MMDIIPENSEDYILPWAFLEQNYPDSFAAFARWYFAQTSPDWKAPEGEEAVEALTREDWRAVDGYLNHYFVIGLHFNTGIELHRKDLYFHYKGLTKGDSYTSYNDARHRVYQLAFAQLQRILNDTKPQPKSDEYNVSCAR
jgi:hypothetical protein